MSTKGLRNSFSWPPLSSPMNLVQYGWSTGPSLASRCHEGCKLWCQKPFQISGHLFPLLEASYTPRGSQSFRPSAKKITFIQRLSDSEHPTFCVALATQLFQQPDPDLEKVRRVLDAAAHHELNYSHHLIIIFHHLINTYISPSLNKLIFNYKFIYIDTTSSNIPHLQI